MIRGHVTLPEYITQISFCSYSKKLCMLRREAANTTTKFLVQPTGIEAMTFTIYQLFILIDEYSRYQVYKSSI